MFGFGSKSSGDTNPSPAFESSETSNEIDLSGLGPSMGSSMDVGAPGGSSADQELQEFLAIEQQKAQFQTQIHRLNEVCWDVCVDRPGQRLDSRTETCLSNCVDRFIDVSMLVTNRFAQLLQRSAGGAGF